MKFTQIKSNSWGHPRFVVHYLECMPKSFRGEKLEDLLEEYPKTVKLMNQIGGRKYHNKSYGGGIVFTSFNIEREKAKILELKNAVDGGQVEAFK